MSQNEIPIIQCTDPEKIMNVKAQIQTAIHYLSESKKLMDYTKETGKKEAKQDVG